MKRTVVIGMVLAVFFGTILVLAQQRFSARGTELWTRQFGDTDDDVASGVAVDAQGNVLVVRWTGVTVFVRKYSP